MKELIQVQRSVNTGWRTPAAGREHRYVWAVCGVGLGFIGGILAPILGAVFTGVSWFEANSPVGPTFHTAGTVCFFLTIPLLVFGGCCLDALEKRGWKIGQIRS